LDWNERCNNNQNKKRAEPFHKTSSFFGVGIDNQTLSINYFHTLEVPHPTAQKDFGAGQ
jgi:hypothetical protein